jgi:nucleotide-binding universal stress UspA family protein
MRRVLVPLDGTDLAASILPDATRLAGDGGELILIRDATGSAIDAVQGAEAERSLIEASDLYLDGMTRQLQKAGIPAHAQTFVMGGADRAVAQAVKMYRPDMIACATHGRGPLGRLAHGSIAWRVLADSDVPVLLHHPDGKAAAGLPSDEPMQRRILVPLDGSTLAETAIPLAQKLATEWDAVLCLVRVVPRHPLILPFGSGVPVATGDDGEKEELQGAREYLEDIAKTLVGTVYRSAFAGAAVDMLSTLVSEWWITDIVMASHGRSGITRVVMGSIADELIHRLHCPIVVVPAHVAALQDNHPDAEAVASGV